MMELLWMGRYAWAKYATGISLFDLLFRVAPMVFDSNYYICLIMLVGILDIIYVVDIVIIFIIYLPRVVNLFIWDTYKFG